MNKYIWYGRIADTAQNIASRGAIVTKKEFAREIIFQQIAATNELKNMLIEHVKKKSDTKNLYEQGWRLYFAYGKNVNRRDMLNSDRAPNARFLMADFIDNHKFIIDKEGNSIVKSPGSRVWIVLWSVSPEDIARLICARSWQGIYRKEKINTAMWTSSASAIGGYDDEQSKALVYVSNSPEGTTAREHYIEGIIAGLRDALVAEDAFSHYKQYIPSISQSKGSATHIPQKKLTPASSKPNNQTDNGFLPADISLPFFAYGIFKQGEIGFERISDFKKAVNNAALPNSVLLEDGLPLLLDASEFKIPEVIKALGKIQNLKFRRSSNICSNNELQAYQNISEIEPSQYIWSEVRVEEMNKPGKLVKANALVANKPQVGTTIIWNNYWSTNTDPFYGDVISLCHTQATASNNPIEKQAALLMAWSALGDLMLHQIFS